MSMFASTSLYITQVPMIKSQPTPTQTRETSVVEKQLCDCQHKRWQRTGPQVSEPEAGFVSGRVQLCSGRDIPSVKEVSRSSSSEPYLNNVVVNSVPLHGTSGGGDEGGRGGRGGGGGGGEGRGEGGGLGGCEGGGGEGRVEGGGGLGGAEGSVVWGNDGGDAEGSVKCGGGGGEGSG